MPIPRRTLLRAALGAPAFLLVRPDGLLAEDAYPAKELRAPCGFPPGSANDVLVRYFADQLSKLAGKPVVVENKPGAFGNIATEAAAKARPDGYTIYISGSAALAAAPNVFKKLSFAPLADFEFVTTLGELAFVLLVDPKLPINTVADLTAHLKAKDGKASYASAALPSLVASELYLQSVGAKAATVNYRTTADSLNDLYAGNIDFTFASASFAVGMVKSGKLRALAITAPRRMAAIPEWPSMIEAGVPGYDLLEFWMVTIPAGTPKPIVDRLEGWFNQIVASDETKTFLHGLGLDQLRGDRALAREMTVKHTAAWKTYATLAKIEPM